MKKNKNVYFSRGFLEAANVDSFQFELVFFCDGDFWSVHLVSFQSRTAHSLVLGEWGLVFGFDPPLHLENSAQQL